MIEVREVADPQPLALQNAKPLFDLVHPGAMCRQKVADEAGMIRLPSGVPRHRSIHSAGQSY